MAFTIDLDKKLEYKLNERLNELKLKEGKFISKQYFLETLIRDALDKKLNLKTKK